MAKQGSKGSITQQKKRYNDDFALNFNNNNLIIFNEYDFLEITRNADWTICFNIFLKEEPYMIVFQPGFISGILATSQLLQIGLLPTSTELQISCNQLSGGVNTIKSFNYTNLKFGSTPILINLCFVYTTTDNMLKVYVNSELANTFVNFAVGTADFQNNRKGLALGGTYDVTNARLKASLRDFIVLTKAITQQDIVYFYQTGVLPSTTHANITLHLPLNDIKSNENVNFIKLNVNNTATWDGGVLFSDKLLNGADGYLEYQYYNTPLNQAVMVGFTELTSPVTSWNYTNMKYGIYTIRNFSGLNQYRYVINGVVSNTAITPQPTDVLKIERIGSNIKGYVNTTQIFSVTGVTTLLSPLLLSYCANVENIKEGSLKLNGVEIKNRDDESKEPSFRNMPINISYSTDVTSVYDYAKATPITQKKALKIGWTDDELGLNSGTSTFTAYVDFYTKTLGQNFTGGGDSIIYKGKELRKYGLIFGGTRKLNITGFNPTKEKGYTIICVTNKPNNSGFSNYESILCKFDTFVNFWEVRGSIQSGNIRRYQCVYPIGGSINSITTTGYENTDLSKPTFTAYKIKGNKSILTPINLAPNNNNKVDSICSLNANPIHNLNYIQGNVTITGFDAIPGDLSIGNRPSGGSFPFNGNILYLAVYKGVLCDEEVKRLWNNGLFMNAWDISPITQSELVLYPDFNNPFDDGGILKIPDLSPSNHTIVANNYTDLTTLQNARVEIKSLY